MKKSAMLTKKSMFHCASCSYHNFKFTEYSLRDFSYIRDLLTVLSHALHCVLTDAVNTNKSSCNVHRQMGI